MRLIDGDALKSIIVRRRKEAKTLTGIDMVMLIDDAKTVDAVPVAHGRWIPLPSVSGMYECSVCKDEWGAAAKMVPMKYCPHCGAKMDLEETQCTSTDTDS